MDAGTTIVAKESLVHPIEKHKVDPVWLVFFGASLVILGSLYFDTLVWWYKWYVSDQSYYSHGFLVPFISAGIIYMQRDALAKLSVKPSLKGLLVLIPGLTIFVLAQYVNAQAPGGLTLPLVIIGIVWLLCGEKILALTWFPLCYLFFMCVLPTFLLTMISFRMQLLSTTGAVTMLRLFYPDVVQHGTSIMMPHASVEVAAACSGFRTIIALMAFSTLFAYLQDTTVLKKWLLVAASAPLGLFVNSLRIMVIALSGEEWGDQVMQTVHDWSEYLVIALAFALLMALAKILKCQNLRSWANPPTPSVEPA